MFRKILLAGAALATLAVPAAADAQYYGRTYGTYGHNRHYYWDGHHYRDRDSRVIVDALIAGILGYAVGSLGSSYYSNRYYSYPNYGYSYPNYGYSYPGYGYSYPYGSTYGSYYSYPSYGYSYQYSYPYNRYRCGYGYRC